MSIETMRPARTAPPPAVKGEPMRKRETASLETIDQLAREIRARRRQVQDALEISLQAGRYDVPTGSRLYQVFASYHGIDDEVSIARGS
jgi:hypothetical protein